MPNFAQIYQAICVFVYVNRQNAHKSRRIFGEKIKNADFYSNFKKTLVYLKKMS